MPYGDLVPLRAGEWETLSAPLDDQLVAGSRFVMGAPVVITTAGEVQKAADQIVSVATSGIIGIAAQSGDDAGALGGGQIGNFRYKSFGSYNPANIFPGAGDQILVWVPKTPSARIMGRFTTDGAALSTPLQTHVGDAAGIEIAGTGNNWMISVNGATEKLGRIVDVLDANYNSISISGQTGVFAVMALLFSELQGGTATASTVAAPVAD